MNETQTQWPFSGGWQGYSRSDYLFRVPARMFLALYVDGDSLTGEGMDQLGLFRLHGTYHAATRLAFFKKRRASGKSPTNYEGYWDGEQLWGHWTIPGQRHWGPFHLWPSHRRQATLEQLTDRLETIWWNLHCPNCDYDLRTLAGPRPTCPECGIRVEPLEILFNGMQRGLTFPQYLHAQSRRFWRFCKKVGPQALDS